MSMRRQREYGMSSAGMRLRLVDPSLHTMGPFSEPFAAPYQDYFHCQGSVFCFICDRMGMGVKDILLLDEERGCTRIFLLFSRVCQGRSLLSCYFFMLTDHFSRPNGSARFLLFFFLFFVVYAATFLGYKYCIK